MSRPDAAPILVTGATGYVGGRLVPRLLEAGYRVRVMVRDPSRLQGRAWRERVEVLQGDVFEPETLERALAGVGAAFYLIHSMQAGDAFHRRDLTAARNFGAAAKSQGVERIVYLGGLGDPEADLSTHLRSRHETGDALREAGVPVIEFRAAVIVGSGSVSFEMIRYLTERLPVMVCPTWVYTRVQPIGIDSVLRYLVASLTLPLGLGETTGSGSSMEDEGASAEAAALAEVPGQTPEGGRIIEIGGQDVLTYGEMMLGYAAERGLRRRLLPVPVLSPRLSGYWVHWVTPIPSAIALPLIEGLRNEVVVRGDEARRLFPEIETRRYREAVARSLDVLDAQNVETSWSDALATSQGDVSPVTLTTEQGMIIERRQAIFDATPAQLYRVFTGLGGERGWPSFNWAWRLRGILDRMVGGVGFRRGRRQPDRLRVGDALDFWRVEAVEPDRLLRLRAEMKVPGRAWLRFEAVPEPEPEAADGPDPAPRSRLVQTAFFAPHGLAGLLYWYLLYPIHAWIFSAMVRNVGRAAEALDQVPDPNATS